MRNARGCGVFPTLFFQYLVAVLLVFPISSAFADFTIQLDAGRLRTNATTIMPINGLLLLVAAGGDNTFSNSLLPGQYVSGNDILLGVANAAGPNGAGAFNLSGGPEETNNIFTISSATFPTLATGDLLGLRWFPEITYAQFIAGGTPSAGQLFGFYNPLFWGNATNNPDLPFDSQSKSWAVPAQGALIKLDFFTSNSFGGGSQNPTEGYANFSVTAVPEVSTAVCAFLCGGLVVLHFIRRQVRA